MTATARTRAVLHETARLVAEDGFEVVWHDGWETNGRPFEFAPIAFAVHHTASPSGSSDTASLNVIRNGRGSIPGPLSNTYIDRRGRLHIISAGYTNNAGKGSWRVLRDAANGIAPNGDAAARGLPNDVVGNRYVWAVEVENDGRGEKYPPKVLACLTVLGAATIRAEGWHRNTTTLRAAARTVHHREFTDRKIDMSYRGDLRGAIARHLSIEGMTVNPEVLLVIHPRSGLPDALAGLLEMVGTRSSVAVCSDPSLAAQQDNAGRTVVAVGGPAVKMLASSLGGRWQALADKGTGTHKDAHRVAITGGSWKATALALLNL